MTNPKEIISTLIRDKFDTLTGWWEDRERNDLIVTARAYGLDELAEEMKTDLN